MRLSVGLIGQRRLEVELARAREPSEVRVPTPFGMDVQARVFSFDEGDVVFVPRYGLLSRVDAKQAVNFRANVYALKEYGVERIVSVGSAGAVNPVLRVGDILLLDDFVDFTSRRPRSFFESRGYGPFIRMNPAFCPEIRHALMQAAAVQQIDLIKGGTYVCVDGPRLETRAEVKILRLLQCDVVGMRIATEATLARELELCLGAICFVTNHAEGVLPSVASASADDLVPPGEEVDEGLIYSAVALLVKTSLSATPFERSCVCKDALIDARRENLLGPDWHGWF